MEPVEFDKIIQKKLSENNELHAHDIESSKPFVWSAIQNKLGRNRSLTWIHLAAAVVLLMVSFSFILFSIQNSHESEIDALSEKIDQLQENYHSQKNLLASKNIQVESMGIELRQMEVQLADLQNQDQPQKESFIYRTDTVYLTQVEYITRFEEPESNEIIETVGDPEILDIAQVESEMDVAIFPSYSYRNTAASESVKLKFGSFAEKKN